MFDRPPGAQRRGWPGLNRTTPAAPPGEHTVRPYTTQAQKAEMHADRANDRRPLAMPGMAVAVSLHRQPDTFGRQE